MDRVTTALAAADKLSLPVTLLVTHPALPSSPPTNTPCASTELRPQAIDEVRCVQKALSLNLILSCFRKILSF